MKKNIVILDPDGTSLMGHHMAYNTKLESALAREGWETIVICNRSLDPNILREHRNYRPRLTIRSRELRDFGENELVSIMAEAEWMDALNELNLEGPLLIYLYCGSLESTRIFRRMLEAGFNFHIHVNLFWNAADPLESADYVRKWSEQIRWLDGNRDRLQVTAPTRRMQDDMRRAFGVEFPVAIHPSTTFDDGEAVRLPERKRMVQKGEPVCVLFPASLRDEKGCDLTVRAVRAILEALTEVPLRGIVRSVGDHPSGLSQLLQSAGAQAKRIEVVPGELSGDRFKEMLRAGHIAVLPYLPPAFARRTSGLLVDILYNGLPSVVMEGTWLADVVRRYDCGKVVSPESPEGITRAIGDIINRYDEYASKAMQAAKAYFADNSWEALAASVARLWGPPAGPSATPAERQARIGAWYREREIRLREWFHERRNVLMNLGRGPFYSLLSRLRAQGLCRIALYGGGLHTRNLLQHRVLPEGIELVCILDDAPKGADIAGVPVLVPTQSSLPAIDAIVVSSDTMEEVLYRKSLALNFAPVFTMYRTMTTP